MTFADRTADPSCLRLPADRHPQVEVIATAVRDMVPTMARYHAAETIEALIAEFAPSAPPDLANEGV